MRKSSGSKASRLSAEERQLEDMRAEILRKQLELEKRLKILPAVMEQQEAQKREADRRRAASAGRAISSYRSTKRGRGKSLRMPSRQRTAAKIKTAALLIALGIILIVLWNSIPSV